MTAKDVTDAVWALVIRDMPLDQFRVSVHVSPAAYELLDADWPFLPVTTPDPALRGLEMRKEQR